MSTRLKHTLRLIWCGSENKLTKTEIVHQIKLHQSEGDWLLKITAMPSSLMYIYLR